MLRICYTNNTMVVSRSQPKFKSQKLFDINIIGGNMSNNTFTFNANVYNGSFTKRDGSVRQMRFIKENAVPQSLRGSGQKPRYLDRAQEVVFDLESNGWRVFNHDTVVDQPTHSRQEVSIQG